MWLTGLDDITGDGVTRPVIGWRGLDDKRISVLRLWKDSTVIGCIWSGFNAGVDRSTVGEGPAGNEDAEQNENGFHFFIEAE